MTAHNKVFLVRHGHVPGFWPLGYKKSWEVTLKERGILSSTLSSCLLVDWKVTVMVGAAMMILKHVVTSRIVSMCGEATS